MQRLRTGKHFFAGLIVLLAGLRAPAQESPELRILVPPNLTSGTVIETSLRLATKDANVLSWQISIAQEGLHALSTTTEGTDFDRLSQGGFAETGIHPDGASYFSIGVLSFREPVTLPVGAPEVLKTRCLITRKDPGEVKITPRDGLHFPDDDRELSNQVLFVGGESASLKTTEKVLSITGCAEILLGLRSVNGQEPATAPIEVRHGTALEIEVSVRVASAAHLNPTGFSFGVKHDSAMFALSSAAILDAIAQAFVKTDGFARLESSGSGFAVAVLSSATDPASLAPGIHAVARASYAFTGTGASGDKLSAAFSVANDVPIESVAVPAVFQPRDALPCETAKLEMALAIGPDWWVRGDSNADGKADLTDAIVTLQSLFLGGSVDCARAMEINLDGRVDISDPIGLLAHLFLGGRPPPSPFPACGTAADSADCGKFPCPAV